MLDCCDTSGDAISLEEVWARMEDMFSCAVASHEVPLLDALDRVLARPVISSVNLPLFDNSAMDGYAFAHESLNKEQGSRLNMVSERLSAGTSPQAPLGIGEAVRIFTGAPLPSGADTVAMQEHCSLTDGILSVPANIERGANCRLLGNDIKAGSQVLDQGHRLRPQDLAMVAATGIECLEVYRPLRVAVLSTGDELHEPGEQLNGAGIFDANRYALLSLLKWLGCTPIDKGIIPDDLQAITEALREASEDADVVVSSGGMSVGEEDHVKPAIASLGKLAFWRINIKPGKPFGIGEVLGTPLIGLPGNPVSAIVTFNLIARPALLSLGGCSNTRAVSFKIKSGFEHRCKGSRREFLRGRLITSSDGTLTVEKFRTESSGVLSSLVETDGLIDLADVSEVSVGDMVSFMPFGMLR